MFFFLFVIGGEEVMLFLSWLIFYEELGLIELLLV
jgi:hypothetical protein